MKQRTKSILRVAAISTVVGFMSYKGAIWYIRYSVKQRLPGTTISSIHLHPTKIDLEGVQVKRPGVAGSLDHIYITWSEIRLVGGFLTYRPVGSLESHRTRPTRFRVSLDHLNVNVVYRGHLVELRGVSGTLNKFVAKEVTTTWRGHRIHALGVTRNYSILKARQGTVDTKVSFENASLYHQSKTVRVGKLAYGNSYVTNVEVYPEGKAYRGGFYGGLLSDPSLSTGPLVLQKDQEVRFSYAKGQAHVFIPGANVQADVTRKGFFLRAACQDLIKVSPKGSTWAFRGGSFTGSLKIRVSWDRKDPYIKIQGACKASCSWPAMRRLRHSFEYTAYYPKGVRKTRRTGPETLQWVPIGDVAQYMPLSVIALEDPGFLYHKGFIAKAYSNSLRMNLQEGRFAHGGSTLTMQLAKNVFLSRDKTLVRKYQEFFLANALHSCFTKQQILELYLNVVQFGPDIYGIGEASKRYFHCAPSELTPRQAFWLASILTHPSHAGNPDLERAGKRIKRMVASHQLPVWMDVSVSEEALIGW